MLGGTLLSSGRVHHLLEQHTFLAPHTGGTRSEVFLILEPPHMNEYDISSFHFKHTQTPPIDLAVLIVGSCGRSSTIANLREPFYILPSSSITQQDYIISYLSYLPLPSSTKKYNSFRRAKSPPSHHIPPRSSGSLADQIARASQRLHARCPPSHTCYGRPWIPARCQTLRRGGISRCWPIDQGQVPPHPIVHDDPYFRGIPTYC